VRASAFGPEARRRGALLGAVFGAYAGLESSFLGVRPIGGDPHTRAVIGAINGAVAATTYNELQERLEARSLSWREWSEAE
jgi:hypothetical protein